MSGGSFNYMYQSCDAWNLYNYMQNLRDMIEKLEELGYQDAADASTSIIHTLNRLDSEFETLRGVWKAVEWYTSGDFAFDQVEDAIKDYRSKQA